MADPIFDAGNRQALRTRTFVNADGVLCSERRPNGRLIMVINSGGHEVPMRLTNAISVTDRMDPYGQVMLMEKTQPNYKWKTEPMIPSRECPQMTAYQHRLPQDLQTGQKCRAAADGRPIGEDVDGPHLCKCITALVEQRQARTNAIEKSRDPAVTLQQAILANAQNSTIAAQNATAKMTEFMGQLLAHTKDAAKK